MFLPSSFFSALLSFSFFPSPSFLLPPSLPPSLHPHRYSEFCEFITDLGIVYDEGSVRAARTAFVMSMMVVIDEVVTEK